MRKMTLAISALALLTAAGCDNRNDDVMVDDGAPQDGNAVPEGVESDPNPPATQGAAMPTTEFASTMAASDMFEIESSRVALQKAQSPEVKKFAKMMVDMHTQSSAKLKALAASQTPPIVLPAILPNDKKAIIGKLQSTAAGDFDAAYMQEQITAHQNSLGMLRGFVANGDHAAMKQLADEMIPIVSSHLEMARSMKLPTGATK
jgi:putative membrane protein